MRPAQEELLSAARHAALDERRVGLRASRRGRNALRRGVLVVDVALAIVSWSVVLANGGVPAARALVLALVGAVLTAGVIVRRNLHRAPYAVVASYELLGLVVAAATAGAGVALVGQNSGTPLGVRLPLAGATGVVAALAAWRFVARVALTALRRRGHLVHDVLLVGDNAEAARLAHAVAERPELGYRVVGLVGDPSWAARHGIEVPVVGTVDEIELVLATTPATVAYIAVTSVPQGRLSRTINTLADAGCEVRLSANLVGVDHRRLRPVPLGRDPVYQLETIELSGWQAAWKRSVDLGLVLLAAAPVGLVLLVAAAAVRLGDRGPAFFVQRRVGRDGRSFPMVKLRTMVVDAERLLAEVQADNQRTGPLFKAVDDPRVTRVGRLLRATSLDELPQLFNVLAGHMSLVGPRPALPGEVKQFDDDLLRRHRVRPGITGLWQVEARDVPDFGAFSQRDLFYVDNWSVRLDLQLLWATAWSVPKRGLKALRGRADFVADVEDLVVSAPGATEFVLAGAETVAG